MSKSKNLQKNIFGVILPGLIAHRVPNKKSLKFGRLDPRSTAFKIICSIIELITLPYNLDNSNLGSQIKWSQNRYTGLEIGLRAPLGDGRSLPPPNSDNGRKKGSPVKNAKKSKKKFVAINSECFKPYFKTKISKSKIFHL